MFCYEKSYLVKYSRLFLKFSLKIICLILLFNITIARNSVEVFNFRKYSLYYYMYKKKLKPMVATEKGWFWYLY